MNRKLIDLIKKMVQEVSRLEAETANKVDAIWDKNYDNLVELVVDESCENRVTCIEKEVHDMMADVRTMFYNEVDDLSFICDRCGNTFYGKPSHHDGGKICRKCRNNS